MKFTAQHDIESLSAEILKRFAEIHNRAEEQLKEIAEESAEVRPEITESRRKAVFERAKRQYENARTELGKKIDAAAEQVSNLADTIKPTPPNPSNQAILQLLTMSPNVTQQMLYSAVQEVGTDAFSQDVLRNIAVRHGLQLPQMPDIERHLTKADVSQIADDLIAVFRFYFDCHKSFLPDSEIGNGDREAIMERGRRSNSEYTLSQFAKGAAFDFNGDSGLQKEFAAAVENA